MAKITFMGAGSTVFARNVLGDVMLTPALQDSDIALFDIDETRLKESEMILTAINNNCNAGRAKITAYTDRIKALQGANYVVNAIQVGLYDPCTITDFEVPKKYGLRQTIADTLGIGGIFRSLRTIPVLFDFARDMEKVCPDALFINYSNPMSMLTGAMLMHTPIKTVGLCHSVQACVPWLLMGLDMPMDKEPDMPPSAEEWEMLMKRQDELMDGVTWNIAGINHMAWLLDVRRNGVDIYPEIKAKAAARSDKHRDMVRYEIMKQFGYYVTESSEHNAEYMPYWIKGKYPELIDRFNIPLDEYPRRCVEQIKGWNKMRDELINDPHLEHKRSKEYASYIMEAMETNVPYKIGGNVMNTGLITNLPSDACVEVPCMVDASGIQPCYVGKLPEQLASLNRNCINVQLLTIEAAVTLKKENIYYAAMLDPHTSAELSIDDIKAMCDDLIERHGDWLPKYR